MCLRWKNETIDISLVFTEVSSSKNLQEVIYQMEELRKMLINIDDYVIETTNDNSKIG